HRCPRPSRPRRCASRPNSSRWSYHEAGLACNIAASGCDIPAQKQSGSPVSFRESFDRETNMLQLYFFPMACSLASRIALMEAGIEARYHLVNIWTKKVLEEDGDFWAVSAKGAVPVLVLENGERLTESAAVLQYIADLSRNSGWRRAPASATAIVCRNGSHSSAPRSTRRS